MTLKKHVVKISPPSPSATEVEAYNQHLNSYRDQYRPEGPVEEFFLQALVNASWNQFRSSALQMQLLALPPSPELASKVGRELLKLSAVDAREFKRFRRAVDELRKRQAARKAGEKAGCCTLDSSAIRSRTRR